VEHGFLVVAEDYCGWRSEDGCFNAHSWLNMYPDALFPSLFVCSLKEATKDTELNVTSFCSIDTYRNVEVQPTRKVGHTGNGGTITPLSGKHAEIMFRDNSGKIIKRVGRDCHCLAIHAFRLLLRVAGKESTRKVWRRERDSNPRGPKGHRLSRHAFIADSRPAPLDRPSWDANPLGLRDASVSLISRQVFPAPRNVYRDRVI
jgi:hypothetical protein